MMIGTLHRYDHLGPCPCGSGQPQLVCCLPIRLADPTWPCPCTMGKPFADCHRVELDAAAFQHWLEHADDFYRTQAELRRRWREHNPHEPAPHATGGHRAAGGRRNTPSPASRPAATTPPRAPRRGTSPTEPKVGPAITRKRTATIPASPPAPTSLKDALSRKVRPSRTYRMLVADPAPAEEAVRASRARLSTAHVMKDDERIAAAEAALAEAGRPMVSSSPA
jgi:hypothetical protein